MNDLPSLHALRCFEAAARHLSMSAAARELHLTHGAISRQVRLLEDELGVALFVRGHRLVLSDAGGLLANAVTRALQQVRDGLAEVQRPGGPLVLSCEPSLALLWLVPRLPTLGRSQPQVHVTQAGGRVDLACERLDLALRRADFDLSGYRVESVMDEWLGPVCAPSLAHRSAVRTLAQTRLHTSTRPDAWARWSLACERPLPRAQARTFDHFSTCIQAAVAGLGVTIGPYAMVRDALASGVLVAPFGFVQGEAGYVLLSRPEVDDPRRAALLTWLRRQATKTHETVPRDRAVPEARSRSGRGKTRSR